MEPQNRTSKIEAIVEWSIVAMFVVLMVGTLVKWTI